MELVITKDNVEIIAEKIVKECYGEFYEHMKNEHEKGQQELKTKGYISSDASEFRDGFYRIVDKYLSKFDKVEFKDVTKDELVSHVSCIAVALWYHQNRLLRV
ncbi:MAG: hypothetical protein ACTSPB_16735 [Candidatus Thorarchaeota archaeon]